MVVNEKNWAGNLSYSAARLHRPRSVDEIGHIVRTATHVRALGSRHSFNDIADTSGDLVSLEALEVDTVIDSEARTVTANAGIRYGELARALHARGLALANLASLPHISVAGAVATATHGSGDQNKNLAAAVSALTIVTGSGEPVTLARGDADFAGAVTGLGVLGIVTSITLEVEPSFDVAVSVFEELKWQTFLENIDAITGAAYSVSLFTDWSRETIDQVWLKRRVSPERSLFERMPSENQGARSHATEEFFGARAATARRHPLPGLSAEACTEQLGVPAPWLDRLPHFRLDFTPSSGEELQSEYLVPRRHAPAAIDALRALGARITPLLQIGEIRTVAGDEQWLSMAYGRDSVGFHFTWKPLQRQVEALLPAIERTLEPFSARPHWGKLFAAESAEIGALYERLPDFVALAERLDPQHVFRNDFLGRRVFGD